MVAWAAVFLLMNFFAPVRKPIRESKFGKGVGAMTVISDLQKVLASCEEIKGTYAKMAQTTQDSLAKEMFKSMVTDMNRHIQFLNDRLEFLNLSNQLNQQS